MPPSFAFMPALPEIVLAVAAMALLLIGAFRRRDGDRLPSWLAVLIILGIAILVVTRPEARMLGLGGLFVSDAFSIYLKVLILAGSALSLVMALSYNEREKIARFEYPVLMLLASLGMMLMVSANDLISLYVGLELQSLSLYVLAAIRRDSVRSTEAGLKYFVLGALSSGMLLYGSSMVYGFAGSTDFDQLARVFAGTTGTPPVGLIIGLVFVAAGLAFKVSAVPFHMWTPDVYEGAPTPVTAFFAVAPKIAALGLLVRVMVGPFGDLVDQWQQIVVFMAVASMVLGAFAAIWQDNIKRLMAYSSIGHVGYALVGLSAGTESGARGVLLYLAIYLFMNVGTFTAILCMRQGGRMVERIGDLAGLSRSHPMLAAAVAVFMFSLAGIPPLAGFFGKLYVFMPAIEAGLYALAVIGVLASVVSAYYYLRIVKIMYFDEPGEVLDRPIGGEMTAILAGTGLLTFLFFLFPAPFLSMAMTAASALFPG